jgi:hypothetical protein
VWLPMGACVVEDTIVINSSGGCFYLRLLEGISGIYVGGVSIRNIEQVVLRSWSMLLSRS